MESGPSDGVLLVDKPAGMTSHDVVAAARRAVGERRIGHTGTLDPFATGLLILLVGRATRLAGWIDGEPKVYAATIRFGTETETDDLTGTATRTADPPAMDVVHDAVARLTGQIEQLPPAYSAKKVGGRRSYAAARQGESLPLRPARITVHEWRLGQRRGDDLDVTIICSGGTYVRALARDLGRLAGSAAHLAGLRRIASGTARVEDAISIDRLADVGRAALRPALDVLPSLAVEVLDPDELRRVSHGNPVRARADGARAALVDARRELVAVAERGEDVWLPRVVLREP